jgi:hypothetical protein
VLIEEGLIVRIDPWELHMNDLGIYDEIYVGAFERTDKCPYIIGASASNLGRDGIYFF